MLEATSYKTEWAEQSSFTTASLRRQDFPVGRERFDVPKSVRSKITTLLFLRSCMCMAETPMDFWSTAHRPPPLPPGPTAYNGGGAVWDWVRREKTERREKSVKEMWFLEVILLVLLCFSLRFLSLESWTVCLLDGVDRYRSERDTKTGESFVLNGILIWVGGDRKSNFPAF